MSQSNKNIKIMILIIVLFAAICITVTYFLIQNKLKDINSVESVYSENDEDVKTNFFSKKEDKKEEKVSNFGLSSFDERYYSNGLKIESIETEDSNELYIQYLQIDGLKNKAIQDSVNEKLKNVIDELYTDDLKNDRNINRISIMEFDSANFSNVLSVSVDCTIDYKNHDYEYISKGINVDLNTGNDIKFSDIFVENAPIKTIISQSAYKSLAVGYGYDNEEEFEVDLDKVDYSEIEDTVFKILSDYKSGKEVNFHFSPLILYGEIAGTSFSIDMSEYYNQIAIYKRFDLGNDLYIDKYKVENSNIVFFSDFSDTYTKYKIEKVADNILLKLRVSDLETDNHDIFEKEIDNILKELDDKIEDYKSSKDKAYFIDYGISPFDYEGKKEISISEGVYETTKEYFNSTFYKFAIQRMQTAEMNDFYLMEDEDSNVKQDLKYYNKVYNSNEKKFILEDDEKIEEFTEVVNSDLRSDSKVIVIDPGHQRYGDNDKEPIGPGASETKAKVTTGATGVSTGQTEAELNLKVALLLQKELENQGYEVIMTRITNDVNISNSERAEIANSIKADAFIRIHANSAENESATGVLTMCQTDSNIYNGYLADSSYSLSKLIVDNISYETGAKNRGVTRTDDMSGINWSKVPTTIIEMGFLSNKEEDELLSTNDYQKKIVLGIVEGINAFLSE